MKRTNIRELIQIDLSQSSANVNINTVFVRNPTTGSSKVQRENSGCATSKAQPKNLEENDPLLVDIFEAPEEHVSGLSPAQRELLSDSYISKNVSFQKSAPVYDTLLSGDMWHRFQVIDAAYYDPDYVLQFVMKCAYPELFIPVLVQQAGKDIFFLVKKCGQFIRNCCRKNLKLYDKENEIVLQLKILLGYCDKSQVKLEIGRVLRDVIKKRHSSLRPATLDLSNFHRDPGLCDYIYCPLSNHPVLFCVLMMIKSDLDLKITVLNLSNNNISSFVGVENINKFNTMTALNLENNKIHQVRDLHVLRSCQSLISLSLSGNPLCENYVSKAEYINDMKSTVNTGLKVLDGVTLLDVGSLHLYRNYLCSESKLLQNLVDHFLEHYFKHYDSGDRNKLFGLYNRDAFFSMTTSYVGGQVTSSTARLTRYTMESRDQLKRSDYSKNSRLLYHGPENILQTLCRLPGTEHDPYSFAVTVPVLKPKIIMICVLGVFREASLSNNGAIRSFTRTFLLKPVKQSEYEIVNEMLHVANATTPQVVFTFRYQQSPVKKDIEKPNSTKQTLTETDKKQLVEILSQITEMKPIWAKKCLTECDWEMKEALESFTDLYRSDKLPSLAFDPKTSVL